MSEKKRSVFIGNSELEEFLIAGSGKERLGILNRWRESSRVINEETLKGLIKFPLTQEEQIAAFEACQPNDRASFEIWIMDHLLTWDQNIAASAIRAWSIVTDGILWHRLVPLASSPGLPQRIRFTILDIAPSTHGFELVKATLQNRDWEDLSPAFHGLLFERCLQFDLFDSRLNKLAWKILESNKGSTYPEDKSLTPAICWLCRHSESELRNWIDEAPQALWVEATRGILESHGRRIAEISKLEKLLIKSSDQKAQALKLPAIWSRGEIKSSIIQKIVQSPSLDSRLLDGAPSGAFSDDKSLLNPDGVWINAVIGRVPFDTHKNMENIAVTPFAKSYNKDKFPDLHAARTLAATGKSGLATDKISKPSDFSSEVISESSHAHPFFAFANAMNHNTAPIKSEESPWSLLAKAWVSPAVADLNAITSATRKGRGLITIAHIMVMSKMTGRDDAVLKLLDHIRSSDETELRLVVRALGMISTPRSLLELINMMTRPNASIAVKQDIVSILARKDLTALQKELRSVVHDFAVPENTDHPLFQVRDELAAMLLPGVEPKTIVAPGEKIQDGQGENLDQELAAMIPNYGLLSSEVKRALRTALFFNKTSNASQHLNAIDLSPLIDMQYKAMELLYREFFEDYVSQILQRGTIQRKLDVIGYARPILRNMDDFESFIATLPVVREIPFFSKFKLRKMLRALCQFEPGKRFTLDGLKAFGLFFLVFGRQNCKHGLAGLVVTGAKDDHDLAEYCRELHIFQDFRNRAAHEGFHPDASNDILGIWRTTALLVQWAFKAKDAQKTANSTLVKTAS